MNNCDMAVDFLPLPQEIKRSAGSWRAPDGSLKLSIRGVSATDVSRLMRIAEKIGAVKPCNSAADADLVLELDSALNLPSTVRPEVLDQAYLLEVGTDRILARAHSPQGLFYALLTLQQMLRNAEIPCCRIRDWPDLPFRGLHITGKGSLPKFEELLQMIDRIGSWKYNALVFEYDDRFSFEKYPVLNHPAALSRDQIKTMLEFAADRYLEIIPSLDSLGHASAYLKHDEFQHLAEIPGNQEELCPSNPETLRFIKSLWEEVLAAHPEARYASITGDEVFRLGKFCPACEKYARAGKLSELYTNYYSDLGRWIVEHGRRPIMWDDMIAIHPEELQRLPKETVFANWNYSGHPEGTQGLALFLRGAGDFFPGQGNQIPEPYRQVYGKYIVSRDGTTPFEPFPYLRFFQDQGYDVLASPMANTMHHVGFIGRIANNRYFCRAAIKAGAMGLLNTTWEGHLPVQASALHGLAAGAAYAWQAYDEDERIFFERFARMTLGRTSTLPQAATVTDRLIVDARGYDVAPRPDDINVLRNTALDLRAHAAAAPNVMNSTYAETTALRLDMVSRLAALEEADVLFGRLKMGSGDDQPVDITDALNWDGVMPHRAGVFDFKPGRHPIHGVPFDIPDPHSFAGRRGIMVGGRESMVDSEYQTPVTMPLNRACDSLYFLVGAAWGAPDEEVSRFCMRYADGSHADLPVVVGHNIWNWSSGPRPGSRRFLINSMPAWEGAKAVNGGGGYRFSLYLCWWKNSRPELQVESVTLQPPDAGKGFTMFFGVTARAAGSARPARDASALKNRAAQLLREMEVMEQETLSLVEQHRVLHSRLEAPEDAAVKMQSLRIADIQDGIALLREIT